MSKAIAEMKLGIWERKVAEHKKVIARLQKELDKVKVWLDEDEKKVEILREKVATLSE